MRIQGFFDPEYDEPCVKVNLAIKHLDKKENIKFMIDTGSPDIVIFEGDVIRLGIDIDTLQKEEGLAVGAGGAFERYILEDVTLTFLTADGKQHQELFEKIYVAKTNDKMMGTDEDERLSWPGLLGRNFLHKYLMIYRRNDDTLIITDEQRLILGTK